MTWTNTRIYLLFLYGWTLFFGQEYALGLFRILDQESPVPAQPVHSGAGAVCGDTIVATLDDNCHAPVLPGDVLQGAGHEQENYYVKVLYPYNGYEINSIRQCGVFRYVVLSAKGSRDWTSNGYEPDGQPDPEVCWGYIYGEDKSPPDGCIREVVGMYRLPVSYPTDGDYFLATTASKLIDGRAYRYRPVSHEASLCQDQVLGPDFLAKTYTELLICTDIDSILNQSSSWRDTSYAYFTGFPELTDNCGDAPPSVFRVTDRLLDYQCQPAPGPSPVPGRQVTAIIERIFYATDQKGNQNEIVQKIFFFRPSIRLPSCKLELSSCDYSDAGQLDPLRIGSFPYVVNAVGMRMPMQGETCNFSVKYHDIELPGPEFCGFKVIRTWEFLDWCFSAPASDITEPCTDFLNPTSKKTSLEQTIVVGTLDRPDVVAPPIHQYGKEQEFLTVSCQAQECVAYFEVPPPLVENRCEFDWSLDVYSEVPVLWHGIPTGGIEKVLRNDIEITRREDRLYLGNLPKGFHHLVYNVEDFCGKTGTDTLKVVVLDQISPIVICNEELVISLGKGQEENGVGSIFAREAGEGSWDNCGVIQVQVRRFILERALEDFMAVSELTIDPDPDTISTPIAKLNGRVGYWTEWADYADFVCEDIRASTVLEVGVWDNANGSTDSKGNPIFNDTVSVYPSLDREIPDNFNSCWMLVTVEDKTDPICLAPHDAELTCDELPYHLKIPRPASQWRFLLPDEREDWLEWFDELDRANGSFPQVFDNCGDTNLDLINVLFDMRCRTGTITRIFQARDGEDHRSDSCLQVITVNPVHDYCIEFPADEVRNCREDPGESPVVINSAGCDLLAVSFQDERFDLPDAEGTCYKLLRTYRVINWCQFERGVAPETPLFDNYLDASPLIIGRDEDGDGKAGNKSVFVSFQAALGDQGLEGTTKISGRCNPTEKSYRTVEYTGGFYQYTQVQKVQDNDAPEILSHNTTLSASDGACADTVRHTFRIADACSLPAAPVRQVNWLPDPDLSLAGAITLYDELGSNILTPGVERQFQLVSRMDSTELQLATSGIFPIGQHQLELVLVDGCGNASVERFSFEIADRKPPSPICFGELSAELSPADLDGDGQIETGQAIVWASDFIGSAASDCSLPVTYSIHRTNEIDEGRIQPNRAVQNLILTCNDPEILFVYIYAWDAAGNYDRCESAIIINDFLNLCRDASQPRIGVAGKIATEDGLPAHNVRVELSGNQTAGTVVDPHGLYLFENLEQYADYTIHPYSNHAPRDGVTTYDLILISKHILGTSHIRSPYRKIAADINNSHSITALDIIHLRKFILNLIDHFPNNENWRFVDASYRFPDPEQPWLEIFPEVINHNNLAYPVNNADFIAIKVGDVNNDAGTLRTNLDAPATTTIPDGQGSFQLFQNHPNPFSVQTTISFRLPKDQATTLEIFDAGGKILSRWKNDYTKGLHHIMVELPDAGAGTYYYSLKTSERTITRRMVRIK